jgi:hypothetical protein
MEYFLKGILHAAAIMQQFGGDRAADQEGAVSECGVPETRL